MFRKRSVFSYLAVFLAVIAFDAWLKTVPNRNDRPARVVPIRFDPIAFDRAGFAPLRLVGAWNVTVADPRFGGVSALAIDSGELVALTDSGTLIRMAKPGTRSSAVVRDLPAGPESARFKANRDSEALAGDPHGRGWWVAFEQWHELWLYDADFRRPLARIALDGRRWRDNKGIEAMVAAGPGLTLFAERGQEWLHGRGGHFVRRSLDNPFGLIGDAAPLADGRILLVTRRFGLAGIDKALVLFDPKARPPLRAMAKLALGPFDNVEAIAAEPLGRGGTRLWLMTDNDFQFRKRTLLVALDLP